VTGAIEQAWLVLRDSNAKVDALKSAAAKAREAVAAIDSESDLAPEREARVLAGMTSTSIAEAQTALGRLDNESAARALARKIRVAIAEQLEHRMRAIEAAEAAKPAELRRREQEQAEREAKLQGLYARIPVLFRTDFMISKLGKGAFSRTPAPQGRQVSYIRSFDVGRALQHLMTETKVPGWPPQYGDFERITWPNSDVEEDESIVAPLRRLCEKSSWSSAALKSPWKRACIRQNRCRSKAQLPHFTEGSPRHDHSHTRRPGRRDPWPRHQRVARA
jgi:hypothetical protein